jgi:hypothetical protein
MIRRSTLIVLGILVLLIGATWYLEWSPTGKARARGTPTATAYPKLIVLGSSDLMKIEMKSSSGTFAIKRNLNETWSFADDQNTPADQAKIQQLLANLTDLQSISALDANSLDAFGLVTPNQILTVQTTGGTTVMKIGKPTPTGSGYYVQIDNKPPLVADKVTMDQIINLMNHQALMPDIPTPQPILETPGAETPSPQETQAP